MYVSLSTRIDLSTAINVHSACPLEYLRKHHRLLSTATLCEKITAVASVLD